MEQTAFVPIAVYACAIEKAPNLDRYDRFPPSPGIFPIGAKSVTKEIAYSIPLFAD